MRKVLVRPMLEPVFQSMLRVRGISSKKPMLAAALIGMGVMQVPVSQGDALWQIGSVGTESRTTHTPPLSPSTTLKTGVFKNGIRYYIQSNPFPAKRAAMWLAVDAGAIQEDDDQLGYAHILEHMAFNGTRKFPGNSLIDVIEQSGMTFGADLNAYTSFDETVYQLTVPTDDPALVQNGLDIIHEWASGAILLDSADVIMERGVILGEWRQRLMDTLSFRLFQDDVSRSMGGANKYIHRLPIGTPESIKKATAAPLQRFYRDWYRPDLMAVIIVGDVDPERMYQEVKQRFERIPAASKKRPFQRPAVQAEARSAIHVVKDNVNPKVVVRWPNPIRGTTPEDRVKEQVTYSILLQHLNEMFSRLSKEERRPFAYAGMSIESGTVRPMGTQLELTISMHPDSAQLSLAYVLGEIERVAQDGIPEQDLELAKSAEARRLVRAVDGLQHVPSRTLAERYVANFFDSNDLLITSEQRQEIGTRLLRTLSNADIQRAATFWKQAVGRSVSVEIPRFANVRVPTESEVRAIFEEGRAKDHIQTHARPAAVVAQGAGSNALASASAAASPSSSFASEAIVSETIDDASGVVVWELGNGARVVFKATANNPDEVILHAISPGGYTKLPDSLRLSSGRLIADLMTSSGNTEAGDHTKYVQRLITMGVTQFAVVLSGLREEMIVAGSSRNPAILFSTMNRQFVDPYIDTTAFSEWKRAGMRSITYSKEDQFLSALTGDRRFAPPSVMSVPLMSLQKGMDVYRDRFGDASDFTFYIVGAISRDSAKALAGRYLSPLPSTHRSVPETLISTKARSIKGVMSAKMEHPQLQAVQAAATINFGGYFPQRYDSVQQERKRLDAVALILNRRLRNKLREEMAVTYGVNVSPMVVEIPDWYYTVGIEFMASPDDVNRAVDSTWRVIRELQSSGPTSEELAITAKIQQRRRENSRESNTWWVSELSRYDRMGASFAKLVEVAVPMDAEEFKAAMKRLFSEESYSQNIVLPRKEVLEKKAKEDKAETGEGKKAGGT